MLVEESDYLEELEYDWDYTLKHSINNISDKQSVASSPDKTPEIKILRDKKRVEERTEQF